MAIHACGIPALPAGVGRLLLAGEAGDVEAVGGNVVSGRTEGYHREEDDGKQKIPRQGQAQGDQAETHAAHGLQQHHEVFLGLEHLQQRAPQRL
jgi:hypothetical protein